ncbi:hypothetical protein O9K51_08677 [Purpureocillium lavendulum]|uniref:Uncharacterized protein n=1 Tax=Purpureocillium lavendulum TaxID=1247861 RepID=A0AB34FF69_9HYPO|nr:hypothetical protein O9K51_08677 [Purpureocillium lavendulum]
MLSAYSEKEFLALERAAADVYWVPKTPTHLAASRLPPHGLSSPEEPRSPKAERERHETGTQHGEAQEAMFSLASRCASIHSLGQAEREATISSIR